MTASTEELQETEAAAQAPAKVIHLTTAERAELGKAARAKVPRTLHAALELPSDRDPLALLQEQDATRVPELVPIRYGRMLVSPFTFYRGAAKIMADDLGGQCALGAERAALRRRTPVEFRRFRLPRPHDSSSISTTSTRRIPALSSGTSSASPRASRSPAAIVTSRTFNAAMPCSPSVASYREAMREFASMSNLDVWYARLDRRGDRRRVAGSEGEEAGEDGRGRGREGADEGQHEGLQQADDRRRRRGQDRLRPASDRADRASLPRERRGTRSRRRSTSCSGSTGASLQGDRRVLAESFRVVDLARKVVGVGSVGTRAWILLMLGRDDDDPLFLQVKEAQTSVLEPILGKSKFRNHGQRVVEGQRLMQAASDIFLGWIRNPRGLDGVARDFYIRQLWDWKTSVDIETIRPWSPALRADVRLDDRPCARALGRPHRNRVLPGQERRLRPVARRLRRGVRRPQRARLQRGRRGRSRRPNHSGGGHIAVSAARDSPLRAPREAAPATTPADRFLNRELSWLDFDRRVLELARTQACRCSSA